MSVPMAPEVSVLMPVYNCGRYLQTSLASIVGQTLHDIEIIIVNDGSTDESRAILEKFAARDHRIHVVHQENAGIVAALNCGLSRVRGRFVARMDGDDIAYPHRLAHQVAALKAAPDVVAVGSLYRVIDSNGAPGRTQRPTEQGRQTDLEIFPPFVKVLPHPTLMVRSDALKSLNGYRPQFPHAEDHDLFLRLARFGKLIVLPDVLLDYRVHSGSVSAQNMQKQLDSVVAAQRAAIADNCGETNDRILPAAAWFLLRAQLEFEYHLDRRDVRAARNALGALLPRLLVSARDLPRTVWIGLMWRAGQSAARLAYMMVRG